MGQIVRGGRHRDTHDDNFIPREEELYFFAQYCLTVGDPQAFRGYKSLLGFASKLHLSNVSGEIH